jgi:tetratricopeptide (TPR) repeat protein
MRVSSAVVMLGVILSALAMVGCSENGGYRPNDDGSFTAEDHLEVGATYFLGNKLLMAEDQFKMAIRKKPDYGNAYRMLATTYFELGRMESLSGNDKAANRYHNAALDNFEAALRNNAGKAMVYYDRGRLLQFRGRHEDALADFDRAIKEMPRNDDMGNRESLVLSYWYKAQSHVSIGQNTQAAAALRDMLPLMSDTHPKRKEVMDTIAELEKPVKGR